MEEFSEEYKTPLFQKLKAALLVLVLAGAAVIIVVLARGESDLTVRDPGAYQAVFLDNGQVYFGRLKNLNDDFVSLTDIYYLQSGALQQGEEVGAQIDLIKLGAELHQPRDEMIIHKDHIVFYEDIGRESEVAKLIEQHKAQ